MADPYCTYVFPESVGRGIAGKVCGDGQGALSNDWLHETPRMNICIVNPETCMHHEPVYEAVPPKGGMFGYYIDVSLREPTDWELDASCNGCHDPVVFRIFEVGSRASHPLGGGNGSLFRFCKDCTRQLKEAVQNG